MEQRGDSEFKKELGNTKEVYRKVDKDLKRLLYRYTNAMTEEKRDYWKQQEANILDEVKSHEKQVRAAVSRVKVSSPPAFPQESTPSEVARGMKKAGKREEDKEKIVHMTKEMETLKVEYNVEEREVGYEKLETVVNDLKEKIQQVKQEIVNEYNERQLFSLDTTKAGNVSLPTVGGKDQEDFSKFKMDVEEGFKTNRTSKDEQSIKLREGLKGQARKLGPDSNVTDIKGSLENPERGL